jgi:hypothetical protein
MGTGVGEAMLISAATGGGMAAVTGGDPLKGALLGAAGGGLGAGVGGALGGQAATAAAPWCKRSAWGKQLEAQRTRTKLHLQSGLTHHSIGPNQHGSSSGSNGRHPGSPQVGFKELMTGGGDFQSKLGNYLVQNPMQVGGASGVLGGIGSVSAPELPEKKKYKGPLSRFSYDPSRYTPTMARGGLADTAVARRMMGGGHLGSYSDGGRLLKGPGDGMSDDIPAKIGKKQPARLADGEFVVPADVVSGLGNGSTDAGAKKLYAMMDKVRHARTGTKKQGKQINPQKYMP